MHFSSSQPPAGGSPFQSLQSHLSAFVHRLSSTPAASLLRSAHSALRFAVPPARAASSSLSPAHPAHRFDVALKVEDVEERLAGIPVYALSNAVEEFMLISGVKTGKSLGLLCFRKEDADALLNQVNCLNPGTCAGSKVVPVALNKVFQLKVNGVAFRLIPDSHQVLNAIKVMEHVGDSADGFPGVPVFQSRSLVLKSQNKRYRPVFFRKEDLEDSLYKASKLQNYLNPALRKGDIQVAALEDIISDLKGASASKWDDVVFVPPGFDISGRLGQQQKSIANA